MMEIIGKLSIPCLRFSFLGGWDGTSLFFPQAQVKLLATIWIKVMVVPVAPQIWKRGRPYLTLQ